MAFVGGATLCREFYSQAIRPLVEERFPGLAYSAGLFGSGSEVLGYDDRVSTDHDWRPRVFIFLSEADFEANGNDLERVLLQGIPPVFQGYGTQPGTNAEDPRNHFVFSVHRYFEQYLGVNPYQEIAAVDWLLLAEQRLLSVTSGRIFHDPRGELQLVQERLRYFPDEIWRYLLACQWHRISQEEAFVSRAGDVGDELGSRLIASRLTRELMRLCFLIERRYAPYSKWFGTAFSQLPCARQFEPIFQNIVAATHWKERERALARAYELIAGMHNALGVTEPLATAVSSYHGRPYLVIHAERFAQALFGTLADPVLRRLPPIGSIDQWVDCTDILNDPRLARGLKSLPTP